MKQIRIGGVPEHFNYPWHLSLQNKAFSNKNIEVTWADYPGGTGAMCKALRAGELDIAILLTEGIIKDIANGNPSKIIQIYVDSPLVWGIHVSANATYQKVADLENEVIAISRYGSGSHLMAIVHAHRQGWDIEKLRFKVVGSLEGGVEALTKGTAAYFMWEHFTTKPLVDTGVFKRIGNCPTPWPCFVIAVRDEVLAHHFEEVQTILSVINKQTAVFKKLPHIDEILANTYAQELTDIQQWLKMTRWNAGKKITKNLITRIQNKMITYKVIEKKKNATTFIKNMYI